MKLWIATTIVVCLLAPSAWGQEAPREEQSEAPEQPPEGREEAEPLEEEYRTPLAGEALRRDVFGREIVVEERDRGNTTAFTLGWAAFTPNIAGVSGSPLGALYRQGTWEERQYRAVLSVLVNDIDYYEHFRLPAGQLDLALHFDNNTIPFASTESIGGDALEETSMKWGWTRSWIGLGYSRRLWPGGFDNEIRAQVAYQASYYYFKSTSDTGEINGVPVASINTPPDTYVHGLRAEVTLDMIQRNILELPHYGVAGGAQLELLRRDRWEDLGRLLPDGERQFSASQTRDYLRLSGYLVVATPVPFLSERHRLVLLGHVGWAPRGDVDRYNGFLIGGGPVPSEATDLRRTTFPGAIFNQVNLQRYLIGMIEYRFEVMFWLYLHFRANLGWGRAPTRRLRANDPPGSVRFRSARADSYSFAVTSGFLWDSVLYFEYTYDTGGLRVGQDGHAFLFTWSKAF